MQEISASYPQSAMWSQDFSATSSSSIDDKPGPSSTYRAPTDSKLDQGEETDFKIPTQGETKSSFQDSDEFRNLISQLNQTLENLKYQDRIYKRGDIIISRKQTNVFGQFHKTYKLQ